jgi:hypothetical protein
MGFKNFFSAKFPERVRDVLFADLEVEFTIFPPSRVYLGFLKSRLESRFQEVAIHQFRAKNATRVAFFTLSRVFQ